MTICAAKDRGGSPTPPLAQSRDGATFLALAWSKFDVLGEAVKERVAAWQNGSFTTTIGPPTSGSRVLNEFWRDALGGEWVCTAAGTPGIRKQWRPAAVTEDSASSTIPTGYLVWNVTDGAAKRHAGAYSLETTVGANPAARLQGHDATPILQHRAHAVPSPRGQ